MRFSPDSSSLIVAGKPSLLVLSCQNSEILPKWQEIKHEKPIRKVECLGDDMVATICEDNQLVVWRVDSDRAVRLNSCKLEAGQKQMNYCPRNQLLGFMDGQCSVTMVPIRVADCEQEDSIDVGDLDNVVSDADLEEASINAILFSFLGKT